jgi:hypothetical protein
MRRRFRELGAELVIGGRRGEVLDESAGEHAKATGKAVTTHVCDVRAVDAVVEIERLFATVRLPLWSTMPPATSSRAGRSCRRAPSPEDRRCAWVRSHRAFRAAADGRGWLGRGAGHQGHVILAGCPPAAT